MKRVILCTIVSLCVAAVSFAQVGEEEIVDRHVYQAKHFKHTDKVVFSKFLVTFSTAASQAGPMDKEHSRYATFMEGVSAEALQKITNDLHSRYVDELKALGYEVLDNSAVINSKAMESWKLEDGPNKPWLADLPYDLQQFGDREVAMCFASGTPDYRHADLSRLPGKQGKFQDLSNEMDAIVISAGFHVYFMEYDEDLLGNTTRITGAPKLYLASNMQTKLNTQITYHYWTEKLHEPSIATYWLDDPLAYAGEIGTMSATKEAQTSKELTPPGSTAVANNVVKVDAATYIERSENLMMAISKLSIDDWQRSIHNK